MLKSKAVLLIIAVALSTAWGCGPDRDATATAWTDKVDEIMHDVEKLSTQFSAIQDLCESAMNLPRRGDFSRISGDIYYRLYNFVNEDGFKAYVNWKPISDSMVAAERYSRGKAKQLHPAEICGRMKLDIEGPDPRNTLW